jgi:hypothetical protein
MYLVAIIPAVLALAAYPDVRIIPYLPEIGKCFSTGTNEQKCHPDQWTAFISNLFVIHVPQFLVGGPLRGLINTVTTVMVMHFEHCHNKYGGTHHYCRKMVDSAINAGIARTKREATTKLVFWSKIIKEEWMHANTHGTASRGDKIRRRTIPD